MKFTAFLNNCKNVIAIHQQSDIEMDIEPSHQRHNTRSTDAEPDAEPAAKRQKLCDEPPGEDEDADKQTTPPVADEPTEENDSNAQVT